MNLKILLVSLFICLKVFGQDEFPPIVGALKTERGFLLYYNYENNPYSIDLEGELDFSQSPLIGYRKFNFEHMSFPDKEFRDDKKPVLINFMEWEINYLNKEYGVKLKTNNKIFILENGLTINYWNYKIPKKFGDDKEFLNYIMDFQYRGWVFRFVVFVQQDESKVKDYLLSLIKRIRFYDQKIDTVKLSHSIRTGQNY